MATARVLLTKDLSDLKPVDLRALELELDLDIFHHVIKVCRHKIGDSLYLFDSTDEDAQYLSEIISISKKSFRVKIISKNITQTRSEVKIHLFASLARGNAFDLLLQKSVELGVSEITPIKTRFTQYSLNVKDVKKNAVKLKHWNKIITHACQQSGLNIVPKIKPVIKFTDCFVDKAKNNLNLLAAGPLEVKKIQDSKLTNNLSVDFNYLLDFKTKVSCATKHINLIIGPEGGFDLDEMLLAYNNNYKFISLGSRILRMETAPLAIISILQGIFGDF